MRNRVEITDRAKKDLKKLPREIFVSFGNWVAEVEEDGIGQIAKRRGYNLEKLDGKRAGQWTIRLNQAYRVFFVIIKGTPQVLSVLEVNKHKY